MRCAALLFCAALVAWRSPELLQAPRFWAEEGSIYLLHALTHGTFESIVTPQQDYYAFMPSVATALAARFLPLEKAPLLTTWAAFLVQLIPIALVLWSGSSWLAGFRRRWPAVLLVLVVPLSGEIWLTTIGSQFHLSLAAGIILVEDVREESRVGSWVRRMILLAAVLTGPPTAFLAPLFLMRAWTTRKREDFMRATVMMLGALLQAGIYGGVAVAGTAPPRLSGISFEIVPLAVVVKTLVLPVFGRPGANLFASWVEGLSPIPILVVAIVMAALLGFVLVGLARRSPSGWRHALAYVLLAVPSVIFATGTNLGAGHIALLTPAFAQRYFYAPTVLLALLALSAVDFSRIRGKSPREVMVASLPDVLLSLLLAVTIIVGIVRYRADVRPFVSPRYPDWATEVEAWRADSGRPLRVWPPAFSLRLDPADDRR